VSALDRTTALPSRERRARFLPNAANISETLDTLRHPFGQGLLHVGRDFVAFAALQGHVRLAAVALYAPPGRS
jgi:site-specific recombinase XerD